MLILKILTTVTVCLTSIQMNARADTKVPLTKNPALIDVISRKLSDSELSILGFTIGKSNLNEVKNKFKSKEIYHEGDGGESLSVLCYKSTNGSTIAFESGEGGGSEHTINTISINGPQEPYRLNKICEKNSSIKTKLVINNISLGLSVDLIKKIKGKPSNQEENFLLYDYHIQEAFEKGLRDISSEMKIEFKQNAVSAFTISKQESF